MDIVLAASLFEVKEEADIHLELCKSLAYAIPPRVELTGEVPMRPEPHPHPDRSLLLWSRTLFQLSY
jgi:hypothetical protein